MRESGGLLAGVFTAWRVRERLTIAHIVRHGPVARNTLILIARGITTRPHRTTLAAIARALATAPEVPHVMDDQKRRAVLRDLTYASGYLGQDEPERGTLLGLALWLATRSGPRSVAWEQELALLTHLSPGQIRELGAWAREQYGIADP